MDSSEQGSYLFLYDRRQRLIAIMPETIAGIFPTKEPNQCFILFYGEETPRLFNHSLYDVINGIDTFYNANQ
jgi:hypothetical protein